MDIIAAARASIPGTAIELLLPEMIFSIPDHPIPAPVAKRTTASTIAATHSSLSCPYGCSLSAFLLDICIPIITIIVLNTSDAE